MPGKIFSGLLLVFIFSLCLTFSLEAQLPEAAGKPDLAYARFSLSTVLSIGNSQIDERNNSTHFLDSTEAAKPKVKLLPDNMSLTEKAFWGEDGILRSTGIAPLNPIARKSELTYRRTVLSMHQVGGFVTMALFIPTLIYGQRNIDMRNAVAERRGTFDQNIASTHRTLGEVTFAAYMATASLALFSPPPLVRRNDWSTITIHKTLAIVHFAGMLALPILGSLAAHEERVNFENAKRLRTAHQITAYVTAAAFTASMIIITF
jgi:hypothetical protein